LLQQLLATNVSVVAKKFCMQARNILTNPKSPPRFTTLVVLISNIINTTATSDRSFSTFRRPLAYVRSTIKQSRLNGLAQWTSNSDVTDSLWQPASCSYLIKILFCITSSAMFPLSAQILRTARTVAQWNHILAYLQHCKAMEKHANKKLF